MKYTQMVILNRAARKKEKRAMIEEALKCPGFAVLRKYWNSDHVKSLSESSRYAVTQTVYYVVSYFKSIGRESFTEKSNMQKISREFALFLGENGVGPQGTLYYFNRVKSILRLNGWSEDVIKRFKYRRPYEARLKHKRQVAEKWLTEPEINRCLEFSGWRNNVIRNRLIIRLLVETGVRVSELVRIKTTDIFLDEKRILIDPKKTAGRNVFFSANTYDVLKIYMNCMGFREGDNIFPKNETAVKVVISTMLKKMGIQKYGRGCHVFRHFCASNMFYNMGIPIEEIAYLLGDKASTIQNVYLHPTEKMQGKIQGRIFGDGGGHE